MAAVNATLLAFAAERLRAAVRRCCLAPVAVDRYLLPAGRPAANPPHAAAAVDRWDRQTDRRTHTGHRIAYYCANGVDNRRCGECQLLGSETPRPKYTPNATTYACTAIRAWESAESGRK